MRQDVVYAIRNLRREPGFTAVVMLVLGGVIGLHTTLVTVLAGVLLRPWPGMTDPSRVVTMYLVGPSGRVGGFTATDYETVAANMRSLSAVGAMTREEVRIGAANPNERPQSATALLVTGNFFELLGVGMEVGRGFHADEDRAGAPIAVAVLGNDFWRARFGADPSVVGRTIRIDDRIFMIVGVVSRAFNESEPAYGKSVFLPLAALPARSAGPTPTDPSGLGRDRVLDLVGRLAPHATRASAEAELRVVSADFRKAFDERPRGALVAGTTFASHPERRNAAQPMIAAALVSVALVLVWLAACANIGNLQLARAVARVREIGVRLSLGASRGRIVRQLLTEGFVVALGASALGIAIAYELPFLLLRTLGGAGAAFPFQVEPDLVVLAYAVLAAGLSAVAFGLAPALQATRTDVAGALNLREGPPRSRSALRGVLLAVQVAMSVTLLVSAGLLVRGAAEYAKTFDPGFAVADVSVVSFELPPGAYDQARRLTFVSQLTDALGTAAPAGIEAFGLATWEPTFIRRGYRATFRLPGESRARSNDVSYVEVSPGYLETLRIPIVAGRDLAPSDANHDVAVINQAMARQFWPDDNPVGKTFFGGARGAIEVVGIMRDAHTHSLYDVPPLFYQPFHASGPVPKLLVRGGDKTLADDLARVVSRIDPRVRLQIVPLATSLDERLKETRTGPMLAGVLGTYALVLSTIGMFGVFAYAARQRTREIGIRMALGAPASAVVQLILTGHTRAVVIGLVTGLFGAMASALVLRGRLHGVGPFDPMSYLTVAALVTCAGLLASYVPLRRAVRVDPAASLRHE